MAHLMQRLYPKPDLVISSPAKRAIDTAAFFATAYDIPFSDIQQEATLYEATPMDLMRVISQLPDTAFHVVLVGHNPGLTELVNQFLESPLLNLPTCGIVELQSTATNWRSLYEENTTVVQQWFPKTSLGPSE
jgi:phosphohistidine phosphatase